MLAATRLIALHKNKGMTVAACLKNRTDYIENPDKTEQGQYVSSYACSALTADEEFMLTKRQYDLVNGRRQKSDVIAYQIHVQQLLLPSFMCQGAQHLLLYHVPSPKTIAFLTKDTHKNFPP